MFGGFDRVKRGFALATHPTQGNDFKPSPARVSVFHRDRGEGRANETHPHCARCCGCSAEFVPAVSTQSVLPGDGRTFRNRQTDGKRNRKEIIGEGTPIRTSPLASRNPIRATLAHVGVENAGQGPTAADNGLFKKPTAAPDATLSECEFFFFR